MAGGGTDRTPSLSMTDREIVQAIAAGDEAVWDSVMAQHAGHVGALIFRVAEGSATREDIEEAVVDCFVALWRNPSEYNPDLGTLRTWLNHLAVYQALTLRRRGQQRRTYPFEEEALQEIADLTESPFDEVENRLSSQQVVASRVRPLLAALSPLDQAIVNQRFYEDKSPREIADALGIPLNRVSVRLCRALKRLRKEVDGW